MTQNEWIEPVRYVMIGSLLYATYLVYWCPCPTPVGCKQPQFYTALLLPAAATFLLNPPPLSLSPQ